MIGDHLYAESCAPLAPILRERTADAIGAVVMTECSPVLRNNVFSISAAVVQAHASAARHAFESEAAVLSGETTAKLAIDRQCKGPRVSRMRAHNANRHAFEGPSEEGLEVSFSARRWFFRRSRNALRANRRRRPCLAIRNCRWRTGEEPSG